MFIPWLDSLYLHKVPQEGRGTHLLQKLICTLVGRLALFSYLPPLPPPPPPPPGLVRTLQEAQRGDKQGWCPDFAECAGRADRASPLLPTGAGSLAAPVGWSFRPGSVVAGPSARAR